MSKEKKIVQLGRELFKEQKYDKAFQSFEEAIVSDVKSTETFQ